jgi:hypothetical protein
VVDRFLNLKESTERKALVIEFQDPDAINRLIGWHFLKTLDNDFYLPTTLSFHYCENPEVEALAKRSVEVLAQVLRKQYIDDRPDFTPTGLLRAAKAVDDKADAQMLRIGLYVGGDFRLLSGWSGGSPQQPDITPTAISEEIVKLKNIDTLWDNYVSEHVPWPVQDSVGGVVNSKFLETLDPPDTGNHKNRVAADEKISESSTNRNILVFISHSSKDAVLAFALIELLQAGLGLRPNQIRCSSVDGYRLPVGVNTEAKLREEVNGARVVIGLITPSSLSSAFVMFELGARWGANQFLAPLLAGVKPSELSGPLSLLNALSSSNEAQLHQLLENVSEQLELPLQSAASYTRYIPAVKLSSEALDAAGTAHPSDTGEMVFAETVYWKFKNGEKQGPYCPACYDDKKKVIHLNPGATKGTYRCGICQNGFSTNEYNPGSARRRPYGSR